ncbi:MAG: hypothetical protein HYR55_17935 [Acidobacteria bacterium]|nr:hypothetical protein [Acidobacteriota bacterium]MBI3655984.1 hypothetical protein [Acidobacteriota bacterium]
MHLSLVTRMKELGHRSLADARLCSHMRRWHGAQAPRVDLIILVVLLLVAASIYRLNLSPIPFGIYHDDGLYVVTAKALATGHGYRIISLPHEPAQTKYPPFYPFLLSLIWRSSPSFPQNLIPMMYLSMAMTLGFLSLIYYYLITQGYCCRLTALIIVILVAFNGFTIYWSTYLLSDMTYAALSIAALWLVEIVAGTRRQSIAVAAIAATVLGLTFLTRQIGMALIAASLLYLALQKQFRLLLVMALVLFMIVAPWLLWCQAQIGKATPLGGEFYTGYASEYLPLAKNPLLLLKLISKKTLIFIAAIPAMFLPAVATLKSIFDYAFISGAFALLVTGLIDLWHGGRRLLHIYLEFYFLLILVHPFPHCDRYFMPILPFLLMGLLVGCQRQWTSCKNLWARQRKPLSMIIMATSLGLLIICFSGLFIGNSLSIGRLVQSRARGVSVKVELFNGCSPLNTEGGPSGSPCHFKGLRVAPGASFS